MTALVVVETFVLALLLLLVAGLLRSHAEILRRLHDLGAGLDDAAERSRPSGRASAAAARRRRGTVRREDFNVFPEVPSPGDREGLPVARDLAGTGLADDALSVRVVGVEHTTLVAFLSSTCVTCQRFWEAFADPALDLPPHTRVVIVTKGLDEESPSQLARLAPPGVPVVMSGEAWEEYGVPGSPYFVLVDGPSGQVRGEGTGLDWPQVRNLLGQAGDDADHFDALVANRVRKPSADAAREQRIDEELLAAGVVPGDPSMYAAPLDLTATDHDGSTHDHDQDARQQ